MPHMFRTVTLFVLLAATGSGVVGEGLSTTDSPQSGGSVGSRIPESRWRTTTPVVQVAPHVEPLTDEQQVLVDWASGRFAQAGLELPHLTVRFDPSRELCGYAEGRYHHEPTGEKVVTVCSPDSESFAAKLQARRTLLHEFGHAWDFANLSEEDRDELGEILGVDGWIDHDAHWEDRGVERFAETFVFALLDQPRRVLKVNLDCTDLLDAFHGATGAEPLGPGLPSCAG